MDSQHNQSQLDEDREAGPTISPIEVIQFVLRSARKHSVLGSAVAVAVIALGTLVSTSVPLWYESEARILIEDSAAKTTALLGGHGRERNSDPLRESTELVKQKSTVAGLVVDSQLLANWESIRPLPLRLKDRLFALLYGPLTKEAKIEVLTEMLGDKITIWSDKGIVTVATQWRDPKVAQRLANLTKDRLLESLQTQEFFSINTAISLLDNQVKRAAEQIPPAREALLRARKGASEGTPPPPAPAPADDAESKAAGATATTSTGSVAQPAASNTSEAELEEARQNSKKLLERLSDIREKIRTVEGPWQRRLAELKLQLSDMQVTYGPEHPTVVQQQVRIEVASRPPPELQELQSAEAEILAKTKAAESDTQVSPSRTRVARLLRRASIPNSSSPRDATAVGTQEKEEDPAVLAASAALQTAIAKYTDVTARADSARFELMIAQVAFQHQYVVVRAPEVPKAPKKPLRRTILLGSVAAGVVIGILIGAIRDLVTGRVFAPWQVKVAGLPTLGELQIPEKTG